VTPPPAAEAPDPRPHPPGDAPTSTVERLADNMADRWRAGARPRAEEYLDAHPDLRDRPRAALDLIAEELALRQEYGEAVVPDEFAARFPQWAAQVRALCECQQALGPPLDAPHFPAPGEAIGGFRLLAELGRGAGGRVFLAAQPALAEREVVLKLAPAAGGEHLSLARLQHTHVVPLYSAHEFPALGLRGLCMPYFGGATLGELLAAGGRLADALRRARAAAPVPPPAEGPALAFLDGAGPAEAVGWVGACLADALQYAHDRGLLHLDIKPSNVLLAADGVPMLLDFHLARPPLRAGDPVPAWFGGTPGFMAPEQAAALEAIRRGGAVPEAVDARADIYSLGVLLAELLRRTAPPEGAGSVGLADVLARCTAADPAARYPTAGALAADLRRHLADLPLRGVGNRSLAERWGKWRRRRPAALPLALAAAALLAAAGGLGLHFESVAARAQTALREGEAHLARGHYAEASESLRGGELLAASQPFHPSLAEQLRGLRLLAERGRSAAELHQVAERVRPVYAAEGATPEQVRAAGARCREFWDRRGEIAPRLAGQPTPELDEQWRADLLDLGILAAHLAVREAAPDRRSAARRAALELLRQAEELLGPSEVLSQERAAQARALGLPAPADPPDRRGRAGPPWTAWEHLAVGRARFGAGDFDRAAAALDRCLELDPRSVWAHYYLGACHLRRGEPARAVGAFSACVALVPDSAWCRYNRGLAFTEAGLLDPARADFDRALALDPALTAARLGRAVTHARAGRAAEALADLREAAAAGAPAAEVEYHEALLRLAAQDRAAALACLRHCLDHSPDHRQARELMSRLQDGR
jgi:tetratricopeptide (TPR) repeat protein